MGHRRGRWALAVSVIAALFVIAHWRGRIELGTTVIGIVTAAIVVEILVRYDRRYPRR